MFSVVRSEQEMHANALARTLEHSGRHVKGTVHIPLFGSVGIG